MSISQTGSSLVVRSFILTLTVVLAYGSVTGLVAADHGHSEAVMPALTCDTLRYPALLSASVLSEPLLTAPQGADVTTTFKLEQVGTVIVPKVALQALLVSATEASELPVYPVYASTVLQDGLTFRPGDMRELTSTLTIPQQLTPGLYEVVLVASQGKENLEQKRGGVTADEILAKQTIVVTGSVLPVQMESDSFAIAGESVGFGEVVVLDGTAPVTAELIVRNDATTTPAVGQLSWALYQGFVPRPSELVAEQIDIVKLVPAAERSYSFEMKTPSDELPLGADIPDHERLFEASYVLVLTLSIAGEVVSIQQVPVVHSLQALTLPATRVNSLTLRSADSNTELLTCLSYPTPTNEAETIHVALTAAGQDGANIRHAEVVAPESPLIGREMPLSVLVGPSTGPLTVAVTLSRGLETDVTDYMMPKFLSRVIDTVSVPITCDQHTCVTPTPGVQTTEPTSPLKTWVGMFILCAIAFLPILGAYQVVARSRRRKLGHDSEDTPHPFDKDIHGI